MSDKKNNCNNSENINNKCDCCTENKCSCKNGECNCDENCSCDKKCKCHKKDKKENVNNEKIKESFEKELKLANDKINELTLEIINLKQQILKSQDEYKQRLEEKAEEANKKVAEKRQELENRLVQEIEIKKHKLISNDMQQLFATIDQFENVINSPCSDPQVAAYISGFKMLLSLFEQSLNNLGITRIIVNKGDKFNADIMAVIDAIESADVPSGCVVKVQSPAYIYNEKVVKHAVVIVAK